MKRHGKMATRSDIVAGHSNGVGGGLAVVSADREPSSRDFARAVARLLSVPLLVAFLVVGFIVAVDPYYVFGSPSWAGFNLVRPLYESEEWIAKPHQVRRLHPSAVVLGSSSAETSIDPRHGGWASGTVFNFALPGGPTYALTLGLLHAQRSGAPLKQVVVGLDFYGFNANVPLTPILNEQVYDADIGAFAQFLEESRRGKKPLHQVMPDASPGALPASAPPFGPGIASDIESDEFLSEEFYLAVNPDVAAAVLRKDFRSGRQHWQLAGRAERRQARIPPDWDEREYLAAHADVAAEVRRGTFLNGYHHYLLAGRAEGRLGGLRPEGWNDADYLAINQDVASEVARGTFLSGYHHYLAAGKREGRLSGIRPKDWNEVGYLQVNPDVTAGLSPGPWASGYHHYIVAGRKEGRLGGYQPSDWDEGSYLAANPDARARIALGNYQNGYIHYAAIGRARGYLGGLPPANAVEWLRLRWPALNRASMKIGELFRLTLSATAIRAAINTILRQSEPAALDDAGLRVWHGQDQVLRRHGGTGGLFRSLAVYARPGMWLPPLRYCFTRPGTNISSFEPFRFMLRRAYAEGTDLRMYITPSHATIRYMFTIVELEVRYEFWLKELVRINEEEAARAGRRVFPLWDFSDPNSITREPLPPVGDLTPMRWHWEFGHFRKEAGDLILDRIFDYRDPARALPDDFGVPLTAANVVEHLSRSRIAIADWAAANPELASKMVAGVQRNRKPQGQQTDASCW